uniref:Uncharacterized protein n=1 Tax=Caenorhabditis japonica TaxID=281687 RepID=A0A8R1EU11_CAEJA
MLHGVCSVNGGDLGTGVDMKCGKDTFTIQNVNSNLNSRAFAHRLRGETHRPRTRREGAAHNVGLKYY